MQISDISKLLSVSERTVYRRMSEFGLSKMTFSEIDDDNLDLKLGEIVSFLCVVKLCCDKCLY